jgi:signal transduction histidine kinase
MSLQYGCVMPNLIASRLMDKSEEIMKLWCTRARKDIGAAGAMETFALLDSLPQYLTQMADALTDSVKKTTARVADDKTDSTRIGRKHGTDRANFSHYSMDEVIFEFHILRKVIFEVMEQEGPLASTERDIIISSIEQAVNDSATQFTAALRESQQILMNTLTHDLRTPLTLAKLSGELILRISKEDKSKIYASRVVESLIRLDEMIDDLLDSSRVRSGQKLEMDFREMDLAELMAEVCEELTLVFGDRFIFKKTGVVKGYWSEPSLRRLIENLITNAAKFGFPDTKITMSLTQTDEGTQIKIHNFGEPIKEIDVPSLFDQFQRGADSVKKKGWGIGLTLVKGVAESHHGTVRVESSDQEGTTFFVLLPNDFRKTIKSKGDTKSRLSQDHIEADKKIDMASIINREKT